MYYTKRTVHNFKCFLLALLACVICFMQTACGIPASPDGGDMEDGRLAPMEKGDIKDKWDLINFYLGMSESCTKRINDCISREHDRIGSDLANIPDDEAARHMADIDFSHFQTLNCLPPRKPSCYWRNMQGIPIILIVRTNLRMTVKWKEEEFRMNG